MAKLPDAQRLLNDLAEQIRSDPQPGTALVGIYTGGVWIAERLQQMLALPTPMGRSMWPSGATTTRKPACAPA
jgi:pyrimidine operon attenuation protein/uracil phosphoribosyltransferase